MTRLEHYASLPTTIDGKRQWSRESATTALRLYLSEEGRMPLTTAFRVSNGLPNHQTIEMLFGSALNYYKSLETEQWHAPLPHAKEVSCPLCEARWQSPDARRYRYCKDCRQKLPRDEEDWMNGDPLARRAHLRQTSRWYRTRT